MASCNVEAIYLIFTGKLGVLQSAPDRHLLLAAAIQPLLLCFEPSSSAVHLCQFQCCMTEAAPAQGVQMLMCDTFIEACIINTGHTAGSSAPSRSAHRARGWYSRERADISAAGLQDPSLQHADDTPQSRSHATCCSATLG